MPRKFQWSPLETSVADSRFASRESGYTVLYAASEFVTAFVETVVRNRLAGRRSRAIALRGATAIRFTALTAARQMEVRRAVWDQFGLEAAVWVKAAEKPGPPRRTGSRCRARRWTCRPRRGRRRGGAGVPWHASRGDDGQFGDDAGAAHVRDRGVGARVPVELQGPGSAARGGRAALGVRAGARRRPGDGGRVRAGPGDATHTATWSLACGAVLLMWLRSSLEICCPTSNMSYKMNNTRIYCFLDKTDNENASDTRASRSSQTGPSPSWARTSPSPARSVASRRSRWLSAHSSAAAPSTRSNEAIRRSRSASMQPYWPSWGSPIVSLRRPTGETIPSDWTSTRVDCPRGCNHAAAPGHRHDRHHRGLYRP